MGRSEYVTVINYQGLFGQIAAHICGPRSNQRDLDIYGTVYRDEIQTKIVKISYEFKRISTK